MNISLNSDFVTEERKRLMIWFQINAPSLGELYEGALFMLSQVGIILQL